MWMSRASTEEACYASMGRVCTVMVKKSNHEEAFKCINECEREQATHDNDMIKQEIYSHRWN